MHNCAAENSQHDSRNDQLTLIELIRFRKRTWQEFLSSGSRLRGYCWLMMREKCSVTPSLKARCSAQMSRDTRLIEFSSPCTDVHSKP